jgi:hypothetical protein
MAKVSESMLYRAALGSILGALLLLVLGILLPVPDVIAPVFLFGIATVLFIFGLAILLRPYVSKKTAYIATVFGYVALTAVALFAAHDRDRLVEMGEWPIYVVGLLAIIFKLFLLLAVSHIVFPRVKD